MSKKHSLLFGALLLASAGFISRFLGFFFRIFLSHTFGEEQIGLYQLIFPVYALCHSLTSAGTETAVSRLVAQRTAIHQKKEAANLLYVGLFFSFATSIILLAGLTRYSEKLSIYLLGDIRCAYMLKIMAYAIPFSAIHSIICGYYLGLKQASVPARSQLIEQISRILSVFLLCNLFKDSHSASILLAVFGLVIGEICSSLFCICHYTKNYGIQYPPAHIAFFHHTRELFRLSIPLTSSRILINILQSIESISIPLYLSKFGFTSAESLQTYGVLTGMALPCILFPSALTNSLSTMLLPAVAELETSKNNKKLFYLIEKVLFYGTALGSFCCLFFVCFGQQLGSILFHSPLSGKYLQTLAWICPFLYTNSILISILNGLGKTTSTFLLNAVSLSIRISGIFLWIPVIGINGYLYTLLGSQIFTFASSISLLVFYFRHSSDRA